MATVSVSEYRADMKSWHERVRNGEQVLITERGRPSVRLVPVDVEDVLDELERKGLLVRSQPGPRTLPDPLPTTGGSVMADAHIWRGDR